MRVFLQTSITPEIQVYDTATGNSGIGGDSWIADILSPVVIIRDDNGNIAYMYGQQSASAFLGPVLFALGLIGALFMLRKM